MNLIILLSLVPLVASIDSSFAPKTDTNDVHNKTNPSRFRRSLPSYFSWRDKMPPAKDQGKVCGSCWAFATIAVMEAMARKQGKGIKDYSEQQLIDCIDEGCDGGQTKHAFGYLQDYGIVSEADYPSTGDHQGRCKETYHMHRTRFAKMVFVANDEYSMQHSIVDGGPLVVSIIFGDALNGLHVRNYNKSGL